MKAGLKTRLILSGVLCTILPLLAVTVLLVYKSRDLDSEMNAMLVSDAEAKLNDLVEELQGTASLSSELLDLRIQGSLATAQEILLNRGEISLSSEETVTWNAIDQTTKRSSTIELPKMLINNEWIGKNASFSSGVEVPIVDRLAELTNDTATIFQRMNEQGDMLRVATNVKKLDGKRAIGTFIPNSSPVVQTVLRGETFIGRAFVVNRYYITAYAPLKDNKGKIIGILYVGTPDSAATQPILEKIENKQLGKTGRYFVMNSMGAKQGQLLAGNMISNGDITQLAPQVPQRIAKNAQNLNEGEMIHEAFTFSDSEDGEQSQQITYAYYKPWDWVIGVSISEDESLALAHKVHASLGQTIVLTLIIILLGGGVASVLFLIIATKLANSLHHTADHLSQIAKESAHSAHEMSQASNQFAEGSSHQAAEVEQTSAALHEVSTQAAQNSEKAANAANMVTETRNAADESAENMRGMTDAMERINNSSSEISVIIKTIDEIAFQTNLLALNAAVEAARAGEAGAGFAVVADEVRALAHRSAQAANETTEKIEDATKSSKLGVEMCKRLDSSLNHIVNRIHEIDTLIAEITSSSEQQQQAVQQINSSMGSIDSITQQNAASAEETASASVELSALSKNLHEEVENLGRLIRGYSNEISDSDGQVFTEAQAAKQAPSQLRPQSQQSSFYLKDRSSSENKEELTFR